MQDNNYFCLLGYFYGKNAHLVLFVPAIFIGLLGVVGISEIFKNNTKEKSKKHILYAISMKIITLYIVLFVIYLAVLSMYINTDTEHITYRKSLCTLIKECSIWGVVSCNEWDEDMSIHKHMCPTTDFGKQDYAVDLGNKKQEKVISKKDKKAKKLGDNDENPPVPLSGDGDFDTEMENEVQDKPEEPDRTPKKLPEDGDKSTPRIVPKPVIPIPDKTVKEVDKPRKSEADSVITEESCFSLILNQASKTSEELMVFRIGASVCSEITGMKCKKFESVPKFIYSEDQEFQGIKINCDGSKYVCSEHIEDSNATIKCVAK